MTPKSDLRRLAGKVALVTGASRGVGAPSVQAYGAVDAMELFTP